MSYFVDSSERTPHELVSGVFLRTFWGEKMTVAVVDIEPNAVVPFHQHVSEQVGMVVTGTVQFTIGAEKRVIGVGDIYVIPGDVPHEAIGGKDGAQLFEVFAPVREELKFE